MHRSINTLSVSPALGFGIGKRISPLLYQFKTLTESIVLINQFDNKKKFKKTTLSC